MLRPRKPGPGPAQGTKLDTFMRTDAPKFPDAGTATVQASIRTRGPARVFRWLGCGWEDMLDCGWVSYLHGLALSLVGVAIVLVYHDRFLQLVGALSGFLLVAPILATSLYALSRAREHGERTSFAVVLKTWLNWQDNHFNKWGNDYWCLVQFGALLALAGTGWLFTSAALITLLAPVQVHTPAEFLEQVVLAKNGHLFELWLALGGLLAAPIYASSVITIPLLLDRRVSLMQAILTSWQVVIANPLLMALWAVVIMTSALLGMAALMFGLTPVVPLLGHASWHAYRDLVDVEALPQRERG